METPLNHIWVTEALNRPQKAEPSIHSIDIDVTIVSPSVTARSHGGILRFLPSVPQQAGEGWNTVTLGSDLCVSLS